MKHNEGSHVNEVRWALSVAGKGGQTCLSNISQKSERKRPLRRLGVDARI
jgi:hypothetical protein